MSLRIASVVATGGLMLALILVAPPAQALNELDGNSFVGTVTEKGTAASEKDTLVFKEGKFRSAGCDAYGFGDGTYTTTMNGDEVSFVAETASAKEGKMKWTGTVKGDELTGTMVWQQSPKWYRLFRSRTVEYTVTAKLQ